MAIRASQAVAPRYNDLANVKCISDFSEVAVYTDGKRTGTNGVKADFLVLSGDLTGFVDTEKSTVYVQNGQLGLSLWATGLEPLKKPQ